MNVENRVSFRPMTKLPFVLALPLISTLGCSNGASTATSDTTSTGASSAVSSGSSSGGGSSSSSTGGGGMEPGTTTLTASMGPITIQSGDEAVKCIVVNLKNPAPAFVRKFKTTLLPGSHHMIVYTTMEAENPVPFPCQSFGVNGGSAIFIAQQANSELVFPKDPNGVPVGLELQANQMLRLEMHFINTSAGPIDVKGTAEMDVLPDTANIIKSSFAFNGSLNIPTIPAHSEADTGVLFLPGIPGTHVFALTTHQHHLGTEMQVWFSNDASDLSNRIADGTNWADPPLVLCNPPLDFPMGSSKGFAYDCHWKNTTGQDVNGGLSANDEMCFFWDYFYPAP